MGPLVTFGNSHYLPRILGLKYYFVQSLASILLLVSIIMIIQSNQKNFSEVIIVSIGWKIGVPPFHLWLINLIIGLDWLTFFIISTWQKILPLYLIREIVRPIIDLFIILSLVVRVGLRIEQSRVKKLIIVSSIFTGA